MKRRLSTVDVRDEGGPPIAVDQGSGKPRRRIAFGTAAYLMDARLMPWLICLPEFRHWDVVIQPFSLQNGNWLQWEHFDGCLMNVWNEEDAEYLRKSGIPAVNLSGVLEKPGLPTVRTDNEIIGKLAAEHLLRDCTLEHIAYAWPGLYQTAWARQRGAGFRRVVEKAGIACYERGYRQPCGPMEITPPPEDFRAWLKELPKPVGLFGGDDWIAMAVLIACGQLGLKVPEQVAVVGANNDPVCEMTSPPLSSIDRNMGLLLLEAARLLERLMDGESPPPEPIFIPPAGLVKRRSTNTIAIGDPTIAKAVRLIRQNLAEPSTVDHLAARLGVHRRTLHRGFTRWLHCAPREYVARVRIEQSKAMLMSAMKIAAVASACGYSSEEQFRTTFKRIVGITPHEYRDNTLRQRQMNSQ
jgi:LacI family transcriptional regulator